MNIHKAIKHILNEMKLKCMDCGLPKKHLYRSMFRVKCFDCINKRPNPPVTYTLERKEKYGMENKRTGGNRCPILARTKPVSK